MTTTTTTATTTTARLTNQDTTKDPVVSQSITLTKTQKEYEVKKSIVRHQDYML